MSVLAASVLRVTARRTLTTTPSRLISSSLRTQNNATAVPIADAVRNVAHRAQETVMMKTGEEGFKSGVLATLLGGSALTAAYLIFSPNNGKTVNANELL